MMTAYIKHTVRQDERWDQIAYRYYGDAHLIGPIVEASTHVRLTTHLNAGVVVLVPVLAADDMATVLTPEELPPWKR
jgi:hypothetical protein